MENKRLTEFQIPEQLWFKTKEYIQQDDEMMIVLDQFSENDEERNEKGEGNENETEKGQEKEKIKQNEEKVELTKKTKKF
ncbi:hypothetical protein M0813_18056 [Anaeramoeba flamelloides]|uniref:Uncharacterized protein n=1 Tax=Anaeramoeba flamelloides TaxID=1746091 RepID=A0ABQ8Y645_9EUKA|nr:hypothetical protein M0813_24296 [Anaeramoeba flamelloides]KAJ6247958.1 hypothetical protein M0813_18056 [Anaeramoeba flamelloides]